MEMVDNVKKAYMNLICDNQTSIATALYNSLNIYA